MKGLIKAKLSRLTADKTPKEDGTVDVQFNPATLKLALSNQVEGGNTRGRQQRQFTGKSSTELTFDLVFDTADEAGPGGNPRSVRDKTALIEQFVVPSPDPRGKERLFPPRVRFQWGDLTIDGVISALNIEMDLFA